MTHADHAAPTELVEIAGFALLRGEKPHGVLRTLLVLDLSESRHAPIVHRVGVDDDTPNLVRIDTQLRQVISRHRDEAQEGVRLIAAADLAKSVVRLGAGPDEHHSVDVFHGKLLVERPKLAAPAAMSIPTAPEAA